MSRSNLSKYKRSLSKAKHERRHKFRTAKVMLEAGFSWEKVLAEPSVKPLERHEIANWLKTEALHKKACSVSGCSRHVHSRFTNTDASVPVYCLPHYREQCRSAASSKRKKSKKKVRRRKETETDRRKRIFANWKNPKLDKLRLSPEYQEWRIAVLERDEYKCQHCEKTGGRLHVHHLKTFKMHPDLRCEVDNGVTLCKQCHEDLHIANVDRKPFIIKLRA